MSTDTKPTIIIVPGSFGPAFLYDDLVERARSKGLSIKAIDLQTVGKKPGPLPTVYDDAAFINAEVTKLADEGKDVIIIGHSYGGIPTSQSVKGVSKKERAEQGKPGGVVRVAYMTAVVPALDQNLQDVMGTPKPKEGDKQMLSFDEEGWMHHLDHALSAAVCFSDLTPEEGLKWAQKFSQHSSVSFGNPLTYAGYKDVPVSWLFCEKDLCVSPEMQQKGIDNIEAASGGRKVDITRIPNDHIPPVSAPEATVDWLVRLAELGGKEN